VPDTSAGNEEFFVDYHTFYIQVRNSLVFILRLFLLLLGCCELGVSL
jgi:hypothetical protein